MILQTGSEEVIGLLPKRHVQQIGLCEKNRKRAIIMAYKVIILYRLYMPSYFLGTFTEYPDTTGNETKLHFSIHAAYPYFYN